DPRPRGAEHAFLQNTRETRARARRIVVDGQQGDSRRGGAARRVEVALSLLSRGEGMAGSRSGVPRAPIRAVHGERRPLSRSRAASPLLRDAEHAGARARAGRAGFWTNPVSQRRLVRAYAGRTPESRF